MSKTIIKNEEGYNIKNIPLDKTRIIEALNIRTNETYRLKFSKINKYSYKVSIIGDIDYDVESTILTNGKISILMYKSMHTFYFKDDKLNIILPEEIELSYEDE